MTITNLLINYLAFNDATVSNSPNLKLADLTYKFNSSCSSKVQTQDIEINPGETMSMFSSSRTINSVLGTQLSLQKQATFNTYRITANSDIFRTSRATPQVGNVDLAISKNGGLATLSIVAGTLDWSAVQIGDVIEISPLWSMVNQGKFSVIAKTASTIIYKNLNAVVESKAAVPNVSTLYKIYSNGFSANSIQIGDKFQLGAPFYQISQGTYTITAVSPEFIEFLSQSISGLPDQTGIIMASDTLAAYGDAKGFLFIIAQNKVAIHLNASTEDNVIIEPCVPNVADKAGIMIKQGLFFSLEIKNLSNDIAKLIVVTSE